MKKYLLIDDEAIFNFIQSEVIHLHNLSDEVIMYSTAEEALCYLKDLLEKGAALPDFILLDIRMPNMNGFEFLDQLMQFELQVFDKTKIYCSTEDRPLYSVFGIKVSGTFFYILIFQY